MIIDYEMLSLLSYRRNVTTLQPSVRKQKSFFHTVGAIRSESSKTCALSYVSEEP